MSDLKNRVVAAIQGNPVSPNRPTLNQFYKWDGTEFALSDFPASLPPDGVAGGDLGGTYPNPTVVALQGNSISNIAPSAGQFLNWNGSQWVPVTLSIPSSLPPNGPAGGDLSNNYPNPTVVRIQGVLVSSTTPTAGQVLIFNGTDYSPGTVGGADIWAHGTNNLSIGNDGSGNISSNVFVNGTLKTIVGNDGSGNTSTNTYINGISNTYVGTDNTNISGNTFTGAIYDTFVGSVGIGQSGHNTFVSGTSIVVVGDNNSGNTSNQVYVGGDGITRIGYNTVNFSANTSVIGTNSLALSPFQSYNNAPFAYIPARLLLTSSTDILSNTQYNCHKLYFTGTLTANETVVFPNAEGDWIVNVVDVVLSGFTLTVQSGSGSKDITSLVSSNIVLISTDGSNHIYTK